MRTAKAVEAEYLQAVTGPLALAPSLFGKRRMAKAEDVRIAPPPDALPAEHVWQTLVPQGPRRLPQWAGCQAFVTELTAFWQGLPYRARRKGELGTAWAELWIAFEMQYGRCPRAPRKRAEKRTLGGRQVRESAFLQLHGRLHGALATRLGVEPRLLGLTFDQGLRAPALGCGNHYFGH